VFAVGDVALHRLDMSAIRARRSQKATSLEERVDIKLAAQSILLQPQHRLQQRERRPRSPGLRDIGADLLHRKARGVALQPRIGFRPLI
jgi:hypothetical protein